MSGVLTLDFVLRHLRAATALLARVSILDARVLAILFLFCGIVVMTGCIGATGEKVPSGPGTSGEPIISVAPMAVSFGTENVGSSANQTVVISNVGTAALSVTQLTITGSAFSYSNVTLPATIAAGSNASVTVTFKPTASGNADGSLSITSNSTSSPMAVSLTGVGQSSGSPAISTSPSSIGFGNVVVGSFVTTPLTVTNSGTANLSISSMTPSSASFSWTGPSTPLTLGPGQSSSVSMEFDPKSTGSISANLSIASNAAGSPLQVSLSGTGVATTTQLSANPSSLSFGNVTVGSSSTLDVTLTNTGNSNISISTVSVSGSGYSVTGGSSVTLTPSQTTTVSVTLKPSAAGSDSGSVSVASNAQNSPLAIALSGTGVQAAPETVSLSWHPSTSQVIGYYVYRGTSSTGPYSKLNTSPDASTSYKDSTVANSTLYYYYVTSVDSSNVESDPSNQISIKVP